MISCPSSSSASPDKSQDGQRKGLYSGCWKIWKGRICLIRNPFLNPDLTCICYKRGKQAIEPKTIHSGFIIKRSAPAIIQGTSENFWEEATMTRCTCFIMSHHVSSCFMMFHDVSWCFLFWPCWVNEKLSLGQSGRPCVPRRRCKWRLHPPEAGPLSAGGTPGPTWTRDSRFCKLEQNIFEYHSIIEYQG